MISEYNMHPLFDSNELAINSNCALDKDFVQRIVEYFKERKENLEKFFDKKDSEKIVINLFDNQNDLIECASRYMKVSSYCTGAICNGEICTYLDGHKLDNYGASGYMIATMVHEYVHCYDRRVLRGDDVVWLNEGLATYFSGQKRAYEVDEERYLNFLRNIDLSGLPKIEYLKKRGSKFGEFCDMETHKYNGYDLSYVIVRAIIEKRGDKYLKELIRDKNVLDKFEDEAIEWVSGYIKNKTF
ncbi:MAG: hypothetical protein IJ217_03015 [Clostridia bacterium]|nr:hypothetical protein [Clostridia bacterium]